MKKKSEIRSRPMTQNSMLIMAVAYTEGKKLITKGKNERGLDKAAQKDS
jgi:hypothetical protein